MIATLLWILFTSTIFLIIKFIVKKFQINKKFHVEAIDLILPFLFIGLYGESRVLFSISILPYFFISDFILGISIAGFLAYSYGEIEYLNFLKIYWRATFILTIMVYVMMIGINIFYSL